MNFGSPYDRVWVGNNQILLFCPFLFTVDFKALGGVGAAKGEVPPPPLPRDVLHTIQLYGLAEDNLSIFPSKWA